MDKSLLVKTLGFPAPMFHGDTLMIDRWLWLKKRLPLTSNDETLLDVGCGTGAYTIGAAKRGYRCLGLSWDERNQAVAAERAALCGADSARFEVLDVRKLDSRVDLRGQYDVAICLETVEHILDDRRLLSSIRDCLKPGGRLLLTTPYYHYRAITPEDNGPFPTVETGWHVRRGYTESMLRELCDEVGLHCEDISYCSGLLSQKLTFAYRKLLRINLGVAWGAILPFRIVPMLLDGAVSKVMRWPAYSICLEATRPRYKNAPKEESSSNWSLHDVRREFPEVAER